MGARLSGCPTAAMATARMAGTRSFSGSSTLPQMTVERRGVWQGEGMAAKPDTGLDRALHGDGGHRSSPRRCHLAVPHTCEGSPVRRPRHPFRRRGSAAARGERCGNSNPVRPSGELLVVGSGLRPGETPGASHVGGTSLTVLEVAGSSSAARALRAARQSPGVVFVEGNRGAQKPPHPARRVRIVKNQVIVQPDRAAGQCGR